MDGGIDQGAKLRDQLNRPEPKNIVDTYQCIKDCQNYISSKSVFHVLFIGTIIFLIAILALDIDSSKNESLISCIIAASLIELILLVPFIKTYMQCKLLIKTNQDNADKKKAANMQRVAAMQKEYDVDDMDYA